MWFLWVKIKESMKLSSRVLQALWVSKESEDLSGGCHKWLVSLVACLSGNLETEESRAGILNDPVGLEAVIIR